MKAMMVLAASAVVLLGSAAVTSPLRIRTRGARSQQVIMCPDCREKVTCVTAGDHLIGLDVNLDNPKTGGAVVAVHVMDKEKKPTRDAKVKLTLSMPGHGHRRREALTLRHTGHGRYESATVIVMPGAYQADVAVTVAGGDTVKQSFSFSK
jgi:hypothetical protein